MIRVTSAENRRESDAVACGDKLTFAASGTIAVTIVDTTILVPTGADSATLETLILALRRAR